jgi:hypothetical protein
LVADGTVDIAGSLSVTLGDATLSAAGTIADSQIEGAASITLEAATLIATGTVDIAGLLSATLADAALAAAGTFAGAYDEAWLGSRDVAAWQGARPVDIWEGS